MSHSGLSLWQISLVRCYFFVCKSRHACGNIVENKGRALWFCAFSSVIVLLLLISRHPRVGFGTTAAWQGWRRTTTAAADTAVSDFGGAWSTEPVTGRGGSSVCGLAGEREIQEQAREEKMLRVVQTGSMVRQAKAPQKHRGQPRGG